MSTYGMSRKHLAQLREAKRVLESAGVAVQLANLAGLPIEKAIDQLPKTWQEGIVGISRDALEKAAEVAIWSIDPATALPSRDLAHKVAVSLTGAVGGAFGLPALAIELPMSTTIMLRSIADIARCEGEDLRSPEAKLACVEVFALGGRTRSDDEADSAYYIARAGLAKAVSEAIQYLSVKDGTAVGAPVMVKFLTRVAARFQVQVTEKAAAQAAPIVGALGGCLINNLFISHFQNMGRGHFTVRRLERTYTPELVETVYKAL